MKKSLLIIVVLLSALISRQNIFAQTIFDEIKTGNLENVKTLVGKDSTLLQAKDEVGNSPLHVAIQIKKFDIAVLLINSGSDVNSKSNTDETPLHIASTLAAKDVVSLLISKGASINVNDAGNYTPLSNAIYDPRTFEVITDRLSTIKIILENGAEINKIGMWNWLPIQVAAEFGSAEIVNYLIDNGANIPTEQGEESIQLLRASCSRGLSRLFDELIARGFDLQIGRYTRNLLHLASAGGSEKIVESLLSKGFQVMTGDAYGWSPLHSAAEKGNLKVVETLLARGADINDRSVSGKTAYNLADDFGHNDVCDFLVSKGADKSVQQFPSLTGEYLGQAKPENDTKVFAADIVSTKYMLHGNIVFTPNGDEAYWSTWIPEKNSEKEMAQILTMAYINGQWSIPELASFSKIGFDDDCPFISPDGTKLFFVSRRPLKQGEEKSNKENIWYLTREGESWTNPTPIDIVNTYKMHWQISVDKNCNLYFAASDPEKKNFGEIFCAKYTEGRYHVPEKLSSNINSSDYEGSPYISPEGNYLLFDRASKQGMQMGVYISFLKSDSSWSEAKPIVEIANIYESSQCPIVSHDGKYLFYINWYAGQSAAFWVNASFIEEMRLKEVN